VRAFGVAQEFRGFRDVARRSAFLIDEEGIVRQSWSYENTEVPDVDELLSACRSLRRSERSE
jgi:peroxiredoxin